MDIKDNFQNLIASKERMIYVFIYSMVLFIALAIASACASFYLTGGFVFNAVYGQRNIKESDNVYEQVKLLQNDEKRLFELASGVNKLKYPDRATIREDINKDLGSIDFEVQSFSFKDYIPEVQRGAIKRDTELVEIGISGKMPISSIIKLTSLIDRKDRIWSIHTLDITSPNGTSEFFGRSFTEMSQSQKKAYIETYRESGETGYVPVNFTFLTYVRDAGASHEIVKKQGGEN